MRAPIAILGSGFLSKQDIEDTKFKEQKIAVRDDIRTAIKDITSLDPRITELDQKVMLKLASYKRREILKETLAEFQRRTNYDRIFPAKGTDKYHRFFQTDNSLNAFIYEFIYESHKKEENKAEEKDTHNPYSTMNGFLKENDSYFKNKNEHFIDLEAKLRPLRNRPDSAVNSLRYKGLTTNDSNMSTSSTYKNNDSLLTGATVQKEEIK